MYLYLYVSHMCVGCSRDQILIVNIEVWSLCHYVATFNFDYVLHLGWNVMINWSYIVESTLEACSWHVLLYVDLQFDHLKIKSVATFIFSHHCAP